MLFQIAIIGSGPAGYFAAQALQSAEIDGKTFAVDMIEKLPTPWGLVRSGVAPDHPKIKGVYKVFEKIAPVLVQIETQLFWEEDLSIAKHASTAARPSSPLPIVQDFPSIRSIRELI